MYCTCVCIYREGEKRARARGEWKNYATIVEAHCASYSCTLLQRVRGIMHDFTIESCAPLKNCAATLLPGAKTFRSRRRPRSLFTSSPLFLSIFSPFCRAHYFSLFFLQNYFVSHRVRHSRRVPESARVYLCAYS